MSLQRGGENDADFARRCGVVYTTMKRYLDGSVPGLDNAAAIAEANNVSLDWLYGRDVGSSVTVASPGQVVVMRYKEVRPSAGGGALAISEDIAEHHTVSRAWLRHYLPSWAPSNATVGVLAGSGDSMEPTIRDGDTLMIVRDVQWSIVERGGIFVFTLDDRLLLKRLQVLENGDLRVISDNKAYKPWTIRFNDIPHRLILHGQVFFIGGIPRSF